MFFQRLFGKDYIHPFSPHLLNTLPELGFANDEKYQNNIIYINF